MISRNGTAEPIGESETRLALLASIVESSNDAILSKDLDGIITSWNPGAERTFGYAASEIVGQSVSLLLPDDKANELFTILEKIRNGLQIEQLETFRINKDGKAIPISLTVSPIRNANGTIIGATSISRNISEQRKAEQKFRGILESAPDAMVVTDKTGTIIVVNSQAEKIFSYHRDEMIGQSVEFLMPSRFHGKHASNRDNFVSGSHVRHMGTGFDFFGRRKDGTEISIDISLSPIETEDGVLIAASIRDVTEQKRASQYSRMMASIVEASDDAIMSKSLDEILTSWNPAAERIFGYSAEEVIGQNVSLIIPAENTDEATLITEKIANNEKLSQYETVRVGKDGKIIPVSLTISPIHDENGAIIGASSIVRDISEQKQASEYINRLASIVEFSDDAINSTDLNGIITSWNPAAERLFGYSAQEMIGQSGARLFPPENSNVRNDLLERILSGQSISQFESMRLTKDGRTIPVSVTSSPIFDAENTVIGITGIARDITEQKQMMRQLVEANELRNEFVAMVAHDIRSPAASISGFAHLLLDQWDSTDEEKKIDHLRVIARNTEHLAKFVEDVLHVARIEAGEFAFNTRAFDIRALAQKALLELEVPQGDRRFVFTASEYIPLVEGDEDRQWQVLMNLLSNAIKFSPADNPITVKITAKVDEVEVAVIDQGIGITREDQSKLFQKFGRVPQPAGRKMPGTGLGLYICKHLVERQGGRLWCESTPGQGSTFAFTIPTSAH